MMLPILRLFRDGDQLPGLEPDLHWAWVTASLSALIILGYAIMCFNWHFQSKLVARAESRATLYRLTAIVGLSALFGLWFFLSEMPWTAWRVYDMFLLLLAVHTWWFTLRMRGLGLVDERLAQTAELERASNRYREIAELLPHIVWTADSDGRIDYSNRRWADFVGDDRSWLAAIHPDDREPAMDWWNRVLIERKPAAREVRLVGRTEHRTFVINCTPIFQGEAVKWLGACADVEDQKRYAAEKDRQSRQKTFFLNSLSHDLRAPLNNVVLNAHLLKISTRDESQVECANIIVDNAVAAGELVTKLLECAKSGGEDRTTADVVPLASMLRQVARRFQPICEQKGLYLRVTGNDALEVLTDRQKLERVVVNLVDNAIKFTSRGGVTLELAECDGYPRVRIHDTGIGVPQEDVPYLFDEFYQVDNHERDRSKGFGMGLAICKSLARQLGGDVRLEATGPHGTCFEILIGECGPGGGGRPDRQESHHADPQTSGV